MAKYSNNILPIFTSASPVDGVSITATPFVSGFEGWRILASSGNGWYPNNSTSGRDSGVIIIELDKQRKIGKYEIESGSYFPKTWTVQGSNTGLFSGEQEVLATVLDSEIAPDGVETKTFIIENPKSYRYYKFDITKSATGTFLQVRKIKMMEKLPEHKFLISSGAETLSIVAGKKINDTAIPKMTSDTAPSGRAFAESVYNTAYAPWYAFNGVDDAEGYASRQSSGGVGYLGYEFSDSISLYKYAVRSCGSSSLNKMPKDWTFEGSNDGSSWVVLDTQINQTWTTQYTDKIYLLDEHVHYMKFKMYRLNWTANNGFANYTDVNELKMFEIIFPKHIKLPSASEEMFVRYGMDKGDNIDLFADTGSISFLNISPATLGSGKVFKQKIDTTKIPIKKASVT
ncbi:MULTISPECIES: hypothetical protein [Paenibacillus]|uniref:hypothetical protein n=1 Tax=Paenibacillus TaxID=44249 RepID=UPI00096D9505|nr:hypothetical protein [Paenibacillus amylolyticus]OMF43072.1 hypothetical protein BK136_15125 [Paenibacillus amylolyticus]